MTAFLVKVGLVLLAIALVGIVVARARQRPNRSKEHPDRLRMPRFVAIVAGVLVAVGFFMTLIAFTAEESPETPGALLPMRIAAVAILTAGALFVVMYVNWYVSPGPDDVQFRTVLGREKRIAYADIAEHRMRDINGQPNLTIRSNSGEKLRLNPNLFDMSPLFAAIAFKERTGRWPLPGEPR